MLRHVVPVLAAIIATTLATTLAATAPTMAAAPQHYTAAALDHAQSEGRPVIVHVTANWCSTCAAQVPIVNALLQEPKYKDVVLLDVDFDKQKAALRKLGVQAQSTFVAFKGKDEVGRSIGETDKAAIERLFDKTN